MVLVTRTLSLRCDSGATSCDPLSGQSRPLSLSDDGRQASVSSAVLNPQNAAAATAATPCSALSHAAAGVALPNMGSSPPAMGCSLGSTPSPLSASPPAQLSFLDWSAALQRCSGNPLARPPLPLDLPGVCLPCFLETAHSCCRVARARAVYTVSTPEDMAQARKQRAADA